MRTDAEIVARIHEIKGTDFFGTEVGELLPRLSFEAARPFLKPEATADKWGNVFPRDHESVKAEMLDYMEFAWGKANDCRGLSAQRSLDHMRAWLWLLGDPLWETFDRDYKFYGKPQLRRICEKYGWDWRQWDNGRWCNEEGEDGVPPPEKV